MDPTPQYPETDAPKPDSLLTPARPASAVSHGTTPVVSMPAPHSASPTDPPVVSPPCTRPRQPAGTASASPHGTWPAPSPSPDGTAAAPLQAKAEPHARPPVAPQRTDRRTALAAHLTSRTDDQRPRARPCSPGAPQPPHPQREAELQRATAALQQRCAALAADLAAAHARQGPLLQRLHRASRAFAELLAPPPPTGAPAPLSSLHAVLSSFRGTPPGAPH